jgi:acetylornithine deacetylase
MNAEQWLEKLVGFDTRNPEGVEQPLLDFCAEALRAFSPDELVLETVPRARGGNPTGYVFARFGRPRLMVNVHIDTVPASGSWSGSPFALRRDGDRLIGLGASDTKGSAAALLAALHGNAPRDFAILLSGDEELGNEAINAFFARHPLSDVELCVVCEPTEGRFASGHRGVLFYEIISRGSGGHSSLSDDRPQPALELAHVAVRLGEIARQHRERGGLCLNIAEIKTGAAFNVIPSAANLIVSARPAPGVAIGAVRAELEAAVRAAAEGAEIRVRVAHPSFATREPGYLEQILGAAPELVSVPFWTEAALFSEKGVNAVVYGPGDIDQAHAADESLDRRKLAASQAQFEKLLRGGA